MQIGMAERVDFRARRAFAATVVARVLAQQVCGISQGYCKLAAALRTAQELRVRYAVLAHLHYEVPAYFFLAYYFVEFHAVV